MQDPGLTPNLWNQKLTRARGPILNRPLDGCRCPQFPSPSPASSGGSKPGSSGGRERVKRPRLTFLHLSLQPPYCAALPVIGEKTNSGGDRVGCGRTVGLSLMTAFPSRLMHPSDICAGAQGWSSEQAQLPLILKATMQWERQMKQ